MVTINAITSKIWFQSGFICINNEWQTRYEDWRRWEMSDMHNMSPFKLESWSHNKNIGHIWDLLAKIVTVNWLGPTSMSWFIKKIKIDLARTDCYITFRLCGATGKLTKSVVLMDLVHLFLYFCYFRTACHELWKYGETVKAKLACRMGTPILCYNKMHNLRCMKIIFIDVQLLFC